MRANAEYQTNPRIRLEKPISLLNPKKYPISSMKKYEFRDIKPSDVRQQYDLVYDPTNPDTPHTPKFSGDFECGNCGPVYQIGPNSYEVQLVPDPNDQQTTQWFFFRVENMAPGDYFFIITGFYRECNLHYLGSKACVYSTNDASNGIGWQRLGENLNYTKWKSGKFPEWAFSFNITVRETDTMYFAHLYPYTYTNLMEHLNRLPTGYTYSVLCQTIGYIDVPAIFWDADLQKCVDVQSILKNKGKIIHNPPPIRIEEISEFPEVVVDLLRSWKNDYSLQNGIKYDQKPVMVIVSRTHPGETNSSFAVEGFVDMLFGSSPIAKKLRDSFSWFIIPMINPDGVICGFYRPNLSGFDMNRVWQSPSPVLNPVAYSALDVLDILHRTRGIGFFLDFHGHTASCNSFVYGFMNEDNPILYSSERVFPLLMTKHCPIFSNELCSFLKQKQYEGTMRVVVRRRFQTLFAYTLEMSYGGCDFGPRKNTQITPDDFSDVGKAVVKSIYELFFLPSSLASKEAMMLIPHPGEPIPIISLPPSTLMINGSSKVSAPSFFRFVADDVSDKAPYSVKLTLNQFIKE